MRISDWSSDVCSSDLLEWAAESEVAALRSGDVAVFSADIDAEEKVIALIHCRSNASDAREALKTEVAGILRMRSEEHTSELQSLMRISYAVFCLKKKKQKKPRYTHNYKYKVQHNTSRIH